MRYFCALALVLCLAGTGFSAEILTGTTLTVDTFGTQVDPPGMEEIDASDAIVNMAKDDFNALPGLKVIEFTPSAQFQPVTSIVALYDGVNSVTFSGFGDPNGYNYGGGTSTGRRAFSGSQDMHQLGLVQGVTAGGPFHGDGVANPALNWFKTTIAVSAPGMGVGAIGFAIDGRDTEPTDVGKVWVTLSDNTEVAMDYGKFGNVAGSGLFFGYQAPAGTFITGVECTRNNGGGNSYLALDDLAFVVVPEPMTLGLMAAGAMALLRRRK